MSLEELQRCFALLVALAQSRGVFRVEQGDRDLYWTALDDEWTRMDVGPTLGTGSLSDDLEGLKKLILDSSRASPVDFARLGHILRLLGENVAEAP